MVTITPNIVDHSNHSVHDETPLIVLESDMTIDGQFGLSVMTVTRTELLISDENQKTIHQIPLADIKSIRNEPLVGGGSIQISDHSGRVRTVIYYSLSRSPHFSEAARGAEQLLAGKPLEINIAKWNARCAKCNRLLPDHEGICPACINRSKTLLRIAKFMHPYLLQASQLFILAMLLMLLSLVPPVIQGSLIDRVFTAHHDMKLLTELVIIWFLVMLASTYIQVLSGRTTAYLAGNIAADLRSEVYRAVELLTVGYFEKKQIGSVISRITQDTDRVWGFLVDGLPYLASNGLLLIGIMIMLFITNWVLALSVLAPLPFILAISVFSWKSISRLYFHVGQKWSRFHMHLNESLTGIKVVKIFTREESEFQKFSTFNSELRDSGIRADRRWFTIFGAMTIFTASGQLITWIVGGLMVMHRHLSLGDFIRVNAYIAMLYAPLQWFGDLNQWFSRAMAGAERIFELIDADAEPYGKGGKVQHITGAIELQNVRFGYDKSNPVIKDFNFKVKPGEMIGFVGKSGAGKSTTINLLCRFYDPDAGSILIDGVNYLDFDLHSLRKQIGVVLQEPFLFHGTIAENISYANPEASFMEIVEAAKAANAHQFILGKPDAYDTLVGEKGAKLSGGEKQRISIARALLHNPRILILDEATSSVDVETEKQIQEALVTLVKGRTTFAIAHRLSTLRNADKLIVLEKGEIVEMGTHAELIDKQGAFYNLVQTQTRVTEILGEDE